MPGCLFIGNYQAAEDGPGCTERNVSRILTTANNLEDLDPGEPEFSAANAPRSAFGFCQSTLSHPAPGVDRLVLMIDDEEEDIFAFFEQGLSYLHGAGGGGAALVHCAGGQNRSATMVLAYLMSEEKMSLAEAFQHCYDLRPIVCPRIQHLLCLQRLERELRPEEMGKSFER